jgi:putative hydrolase of the HAD superfamily
LNQNKERVKAVLFDLDDTLFDHRYSCRNGLAALKQNYDFIKSVSLKELEKDYINVLNEIHLSKVLTGLYTLDEARNERIRILFSKYNGDTSESIISEARAIYSSSYKAIQQEVPGAKQLLAELKKKVKIGIVSNNFLKEQLEKINRVGLASYIDVVVASEEVGVTKPNPEIFMLTLERLNCKANEAVMLGDTWEIDIIGAKNAGIAAIWFNRYGLHCPDPLLSKEINTFEPVEKAVKIIFN